MKLPFRRNKDTTSVPAEIQEYYQAERRDRTGVAWLLALGTLIITIGLATLLFFGGRWAYRAIVNNDDNTETAQNEESSESSPENAENPDSPESAPSTEPAPAGPSTGTSSTSTSTPNSPTPTSTGSNTPVQTSTPTTGPSVAGTTTNLPNTGAGDIVSIFAITSAVGAAAHYAISSRRSES